MTTIFRKELRDVLRWTPLGVIVIGLLCWQKIPSYIDGCYNLPYSIANNVIIGSGLFALALGLLQSMFDLRTDARGFLLHRPILARDIFRGKLAAGFVAHTLAWSIPLVLAAIYLESIGPERLPVTWSDIVLSALCCSVSFLFHPAGTWMACREARWLGTKCLPLVLPVIACVAAISLAEFDSTQWQLAIPTVIIAVMIWVIVAASKHAQMHQTFLPAPASEESWSWSNAVGITTASIVAAVTVGTIVVGWITMSQATLSLKANRQAISEDGQLWDIEETWKAPRDWDDEPIHRSGRALTGPGAGNSSFVELTETWREVPSVFLRSTRSLRIRTTSGFFRGYKSQSSTASKDNRGFVSIYERYGKLYLYDWAHGLIGIVTPHGIFRPDETPHGSFRNLDTLDGSDQRHHSYHTSLRGQRLLADISGIYQLDVDAYELRRLSDVPTFRMAITLPSDQHPQAQLWTRDSQTAHRFSIRPRSENLSLPSFDSELVKATHGYPLPNVEITADGGWSLDWIDDPDQTSLSVASLSNNNAVVIANDKSTTWRYRIGKSDGSTIASGELPDFVTSEENVPYATFLFPPAPVTGTLVVFRMMEPDIYGTLKLPKWAWLLVAFHAIIGGCGAFLLSRSRVPSKQLRLLSFVVGVLFGIPAWLAVVAVHPRLIVEPCTSCQRRRRIDTDRCEHCDAKWDIPESAGIELIGPREFAQVARYAPPAC